MRISARLLALVLTVVGAVSVHAQERWNIRIGADQTTFAQGGQGQLSVFLSSSPTTPSSSLPLSGFSLAFGFNHPDSVVRSALESYFPPSSVQANIILPGVKSVSTGSAMNGSNYDFLVNWSASGDSFIIPTNGNEVELFTLSFNVASETPLTAMLSDVNYELNFLPNAHQSTPSIPANELVFNVPSGDIGLNVSNSSSSGGQFSVGQAVPEPASIVLCGIGMGLAALGTRRRLKATKESESNEDSKLSNIDEIDV